MNVLLDNPGTLITNLHIVCVVTWKSLSPLTWPLLLHALMTTFCDNFAAENFGVCGKRVLACMW